MQAVLLMSRDELNNGPGLENTTTALLVLATLFVALRFWARYSAVAQYGADDWMAVAALLGVFAAGGINYAMISHGLGRHATDLAQDDLIIFFKLLLAFECVYVTGVMLVKLSVLKMYLRIFPSSGFRVAAAIIAAIVTAWCIAIILVCIFQCNPISKAWYPWIDGQCINLKGSFIGNAVPNILTDVAILCMPIRQVLKLKINTAQRLSLCLIFLSGSFVLVASIYRFTTIMQFDILDTTWTLATACTWCVVEVACGVISACLPTLRPIMTKISNRFGSLRGKTTTYGSEPATKVPVELVTIGGTNGKFSERFGRRTENSAGGKSAGVFSRLDDSSDGGSGDELPLHGTIRKDETYTVDWTKAI
ncbi:hypothetical protein BX600DRAFT_551782 [Xylariales sp. PMI_506]|nr:hypothetical protein BX600DRAFT_551782 [Xylariales sp. PMI_506]